MESLTEEFSFVKCALLSSWNHTLGPQVMHWWKSKASGLEVCTKILERKKVSYLQQLSTSNDEQNSNLESSLLNQDLINSYQTENANNCPLHSYPGCTCVKNGDTILRNAEQMVGQLLLGELEHISPDSEISSRLYYLPDSDLTMVSTIFNGMNASGNHDVNQSENMFLCLAMVFKKEHLNFVMDVYTLIDVKLRRATDLLLQYGISPSCDGPVTVILDELSKLLSSLYLSSKKSTQVTPFKKHLDKIRQKMIERALVSHLQTCGCSVVLGDSINDVNKMVHFLSTFVSDEENLCSRYAQIDELLPYHPGLCIQGLLKDSSGEADVWVRDIMQNRYPTTVIDLSHGKIRQTALSTFHRRTGVKEENDESTLLNAHSERSFLHTVKDTGMLVPDLLQELELIGNQDDKEKYLKCFTKCLEIKACAMVKTKEECRSKEKTFPKLVKAILGTSEEADLNIVESFAEKLRPGVAVHQWEKG